MNNDPGNIQANYDPYIQVQDQIDQIFVNPSELCKRSITMIAKCGDLSCDNSIVQYCSDVWQIKSVEVPNPSLSAVQRVKSHSYLHL